MQKKYLILTLFILLYNTMIFAQAPQGLNYQAVAYDGAGVPVANQLLGVRLSILDGSATGTLVYQETQTPNTDNTGLFSIVIGNGTVVSGTFNTINWGNGSKWLKTEIDITGGTSYVAIGTTQFMSVPYALYANAAGPGSASFTNPDGFNNITTVVIPDSVNYTVPAGKNLYIPSCMLGVSIDGNKIQTGMATQDADAKVLVGASENSVVYSYHMPRVCFLVDKKVDWKTLNLMNASFTVPANKQLVIISTENWYDESSGPQPPGCQMFINGVPYDFINYKWPMLTNSIIDEGMTIATAGCTGGHFKFVINGYLRNK
ncbi:MAG: hypothetical protein QM737_03935 [Ferruginibacter sp.]